MELTDEQLETIAANSYRNFHAKGLDYVCLNRSPKVTQKIYFFDCDLEQVPEVVIPHDHRYDFVTTCISGGVTNKKYSIGIWRDTNAQGYEKFSYRTPLNGGDGFAWEDTVFLSDIGSKRYHPGENYVSPHWDIHTIQITAPQTCLYLVQMEDRVPLDEPTHAYRPMGLKDPPSLDGLYERMDVDHVRKLLDTYGELVGRL
jgi:hypothetical protein